MKYMICKTKIKIKKQAYTHSAINTITIISNLNNTANTKTNIKK